MRRCLWIALLLASCLAPPELCAQALSVGGGPGDSGYNVGSTATIRASLKGVEGGANRYAVFADIQYAGTTAVTSVQMDQQTASAPGDPARDIAEFAFDLRKRAMLAGDPRADALELAFMDGYLANAPEEHLDNIGFYAGCAVLQSLVSNAPSGRGDLMDWIDFHDEEFDRWVLPSPIRILLPGA